MLFADAKVIHFLHSHKFFGEKIIFFHYFYYLCTRKSGCSAVGSALRSGRRGRAFESPHPDNQQGCEVMKWLINSHFIVYFGFILACIWPGTGCWRSTADLWETSMVPFIDHAVSTTPCHNDGLQEVNIRARSKRKRSFTYYLLYFSSKSSVSFLSSSLQLTILRDKMMPSGAKSILWGIPFTP